MSSFLMNPGASTYQHQQHLGGTPVVVDPKFPPTEEYSQNNYIPSGGDFFGGHHLNHPQHHLQYGYHNHHQATTNPYGTPNLPNGGYGYSNYYHQLPPSHPGIHTHQLRPALSMHSEPQQLPCGSLQGHQPPSQSTAVSNSGTILQNLADIAPTGTQTNGPTNDVNSGVCSPASVSHGTQDSRGSPAGHAGSLQDLGIRLEDNASDEHEELDDEQMESPLMEEEEDEDSESGENRVIYPWMKKIHVAGVGEYLIFNK